MKHKSVKRKKYPREFVVELKRYLDITEVIMWEMNRGRWKKLGDDWYHICPFHKEKHASFTIVPYKQFYHCFGCGAGGDVIGFIMEFHHCDFLDAIEYLVHKYRFQKHWRQYQQSKKKGYKE